MEQLGRYNLLLRPGIMGVLLMAAAACGPVPPGGETRDFVLADSGAGRPTVTADAGSGALYVAWTQQMGGETDVYLSRLEASADSFSSPVRVNDRPGDAAAHDQAPAQATAGPDGTVYVAWIAQTLAPGRRFPASDIRLARSTDGGMTFAPAVTVNEAEAFPTSHHFHNLAVGPDGTVYVSWLDSSERDRALLQDETTPPMQPAHDDGHGSHAGREPENLPGTELRVARSTDGGRTFEPSLTVARGTCQCCRTALAVSPSGTVYLAWRHIFGEHIRDMALATSTDGGRTFSEPVRVHEDNWQINGCPHSGPALAVNDRGEVVVAWYTGAEGGAGAYVAASQDEGRTFGPATPLVRGVPGSQVSASVAGDRMLLAWEDSQQRGIQVAGLDDTGREPAELYRVEGKLPSLAAGRGRTVLAWQEGQGVRVRIDW